jgi:Xaa-Pro aminopeptidase
MVESNTKLTKIRALMAENKIDAYVCFHMDAHNSEYIAECDERIAFISGFKGSAGVTVMTQEHAKLWTDSRYFLAGAEQLETGWVLEKQLPENKSWFEWIAADIGAGKTVGWDFTQYPSSVADLRKKFFNDKQIEVSSVDNLVDLVWGEDRPVRPKNEVKFLEQKFSGQSSADKVENLKKKINAKESDPDVLLVTALDEIAWITNCRGSDIDCNPVFFSYLILDFKENSCTLFIDESKMQKILDDKNTLEQLP